MQGRRSLRRGQPTQLLKTPLPRMGNSRSARTKVAGPGTTAPVATETASATINTSPAIEVEATTHRRLRCRARLTPKTNGTTRGTSRCKKNKCSRSRDVRCARRSSRQREENKTKVLAAKLRDFHATFQSNTATRVTSTWVAPPCNSRNRCQSKRATPRCSQINKLSCLPRPPPSTPRSRKVPGTRHKVSRTPIQRIQKRRAGTKRRVRVKVRPLIKDRVFKRRQARVAKRTQARGI